MKSKKSILEKKFYYISLYLDDLKEIAQIINDNNSGYEVETERYSYNSIDELLENESKINTLNIISYKPSYKHNIFIFIGRKVALIRIMDNDTLSQGIFTRIEKIFERRKINQYYFYLTTFAASIVTVCLLSILLNKFFSDNKILFIISFISVVILNNKISEFFFTNKIYLLSSDKKSSFFQRKKDDLIIAVISGILGAIFGSVGTVIIQQMFNVK